MNAPEGDRRWLAVLSTDMVGFTELSKDVGPEKMYELLGVVLGHARRAIEDHGGHVIDTAGDGILAAFGAPDALENASLESCRAARAFHDSLAQETPSLEQRFGIKPQFRTGIAGGNAMVAHLDDGAIKVVGEPVNAAARLQSLAKGGSVLVSEDIRREAEGLVETDDLGPQQVKGFAEPLHVHQLGDLVETLTKFEASQRRGLIDLISRRNELLSALDKLSENTPPGLVVISGPPGIGKSRLTHEISVTLPNPVYIGQCAPTGQTPAYGPLLDILRQAAHAPTGAGRRQIFEALFARHPTLADTTAAEEFLDVGENSRSQTDRALKDRTFLINLLRGLQKSEDAVFVIEDVHWIDTATNGLIAALGTDPVPLIATCRPEFRADWLDFDTTHRINLPPLTATDIRTLVEASLGEQASSRLNDFVTDKAEGNPLMAEELIRALRQGERLKRTGEGMDIQDAEGTVLTGNLEQLVLARVDRLQPEDKAALQHASVIGRDFSADLLTASLGRSTDLDAIAEVPGLIEPSPNGDWRFSHALIRDAVYDSLLSGQRRQSHARIAEALQSSEARLAGNWALLAEHHLQSATPERATPALIRAAQDSLNVYALYETDHQLEQALGFLETDPDLASDNEYQQLAVTWLRALIEIGDFGRVERVSARVLPRLEKLGYSPQLSIARTLTSIAKNHARDYRGAEDMALATLADAEAQGDDWGAAWAKVSLMRTYEETAWQGLDTLERLAREIQPVARATGDHPLEMTSIYLLCSGHRSVGSHRRAIELANKIGAFAEQNNDRRARAYAGWSRAIIYIVQGDPERAHQAILKTRDNVIRGAADDRVSAGIILFTEIFILPADEIRPKIDALIDESRSLKDFNIVHSMEWSRAMLEFRAGNLAVGSQLLDKFIHDAGRSGHMALLRQALMTRAEVALSIAGLIDPASEAPPERPVPPKKRPGFSDIMTFARIKLGAKKQAEADLTRALSLTSTHMGAHAARCEAGLGLIAAARGDKTRAREHLVSCLNIIEDENIEIIENRARKALDAL